MHDAEAKYFPYLDLLFAVIAWGASFIAIKNVVKGAPPITVVWARFGMDLAILGITVFTPLEFAWPAKFEPGVTSQ